MKGNQVLQIIDCGKPNINRNLPPFYPKTCTKKFSVRESLHGNYDYTAYAIDTKNARATKTVTAQVDARGVLGISSWGYDPSPLVWDESGIEMFQPV